MTERQFDEICGHSFVKKDNISVEEFLKTLFIKSTDYSFSDIQNAFKLLAKDNATHLKLSKIRKILEKSNLTEMEIVFLTNQLSSYTNSEGKVNYKKNSFST